MTCRSRFSMSGLYELPYGVSLSGSYQHQSGFPELTTVSVGNNTVALTQGTQAVNVAPRGDVRYPKLNQLDFSLRKAIRFGSEGVSTAIGRLQRDEQRDDSDVDDAARPNLPPAERDSAGDAHQGGYPHRFLASESEGLTPIAKCATIYDKAIGASYRIVLVLNTLSAGRAEHRRRLAGLRDSPIRASSRRRSRCDGEPLRFFSS